MDSYTPLLDKTRLPQPSLQKFAVISIFSKLRSAPPQLGPDSEPGRDAISQCLQSTSPAVLDQSLREFCCLLADSVLDLSVGLLELHSALEGSEPKFVPLFVKALGFVARLGFERRNVSCKFGSVENHPFVKILSSRSEVHAELVQQILLFMVRNKQLGMVEVCEFLRPFFNFSIIRIPFSDSLSSLFVRQLVSSVASLCCSFPDDALPVFKLLIGCLNNFPQKKLDEHKNFNYIVECTVDAYIVVLRHLVLKGSLVTESQMCGVELFGTVVSLCTSPHKHSSSIEPIVELLKCILVAQRDLSLQYKPELSSAILSLFAILIESELEHEQLCILKLLLFLLNWKSGTDFGIYGATSDLNEELLLIFPALNLMSTTSKPVKKAASDLLFMLEKPLVKLLSAQKLELAINGGYPPISRPEFFVFRVLKHMWFQDQSILLGSSFLTLDSVGGSGIKEMDNGPKPWTSQLREYLLWIVDRQKSSQPISASHKTFSNEMLLLCAIASVLMMHPSLWNSAIDLAAAIGLLDPKLGVPLLLVVLFYSNVFSRKDVICHNMLLKLLGMLPSLASQSAMIPLVVQTFLPMLHKDAKPVLYATAIRLLCQTWEINDRVFGSLQGVLYPKGFTDFMYERNICISMAASIFDVCRKNPDRGVDLILSVSACIESQDPIVQALGFQSLAHLCEADVIDFYTAWDVIAKHMLDYSLDPILAQSICLLLRWGAMDAEAYPEASRTILKILWDAGTAAYPDHELRWVKARASAFEALSQYEVSQIDKNILDFKKRSMEVLCSETNQDVLRAMEGFQVKIISHEHINRRRFIKDKKVPGSKVEKLLDVFPQVIFSSGKKSYARDLPGAALLCLSFTPKDLKNQGVSRGLRDVHVAYENALVDIAASLQLSRNIFVALLSLQSWKSFMRRWMRANVFLIDAKAESIALDRTSKAANDILKRTIRVSEESLPRSAENIALAIGALGAVLPPSAHTIKSTASKFLLSWLFQHEHEHRQWSAALSLGLISSSLHVTDHKQKFQNINGLIEVLCGSRSTLVKGACGVGLGFSCQDLLARIEAVDNPNMDKETYNMQEMELLGRTVKVLAHMLCQLAPSSSNILKSLSAHLPVNSDVDTNITPEWLLENFEDLEDDVWGVAGLVLGLANSIGALYRAGAEDAVLKIKDLIISWIPHVNYLVQNSDFHGDRSEKFLSIGSCVALPIVVAFCRRVELMDDKELDHLVNGYRELISELISVNKSSNFHKNLLMASCIGAGSLLSCILNEGVHSIKVEHLNSLMELFKKCYSNPYPPIIHLGGMLGVVNSLGASAGFFVNVHALTSSMHAGSAHKEHSSILGPLLSDPVCEQYVTSVIQDIFLVAQNSDDQQLQQYAAWAMSFLQNHLRSKELLNVDNNIQTDEPGSKSVTQSFSEDSAVMKLSLWLTSLNYSGTDTDVHVATVSTVLRCLSRAPRLPTLDWGAIIRRCMRYEVQVAKLLPPDSADMRGTLREECIQFSLAHANQFDSLLTFLDELSDLSRFRSLELNLQAFLLFHLPDLVKLFSGSRLEKLFDDIKNFFSLVSSHQDPDQKSFLRISCWKGLYLCLEEVSLDSLDYIQNMEKCMEVLFTLLPASKSTKIGGTNKTNMVEEWSKAVACLGKTRQEWLLDFLQVSHVDTVQGDAQLSEALKKIQATAKLVRIGSFPLTQLGKLKAYVLNFESLGIWDVLVEVVAALQQADTSVKRQWLVDAVEISCVSCYPSTSLQFLGLLSGSCCRYMPLLILDRITVLNDLPVTLTSLLSEPNWGTVAEPFVSYLWVSTERIYDWATSIGMGESESSTSSQSIDRSENGMAAFLLRMMHCACVSLKDYLPLEKQLKLSNMLVKEEMG